MIDKSCVANLTEVWNNQLQFMRNNECLTTRMSCNCCSRRYEIWGACPI